MQDQPWLKSKMDSLFEMKKKLEANGKDFNTSIQAGREYRNPRICEKLIEKCNIYQYGTNFTEACSQEAKLAQRLQERSL